MRRKARRLNKPYPPTAEIPDAGLTLFEADWARSYALARADVIITIATGARRTLALMHPTCAKLGVSLLHTLDPTRTLFVDVEAGDLAVQDVPVDTIRLDDWSTARDLACRIGGPNPSFPPNACYSQAHYDAVGGALDHLDEYDTIFVDSITATGRISFRWAEQQPECITRNGAKDVRAAYGQHAREMLMWLHQLQHARAKNIIFIGILERLTDGINHSEFVLQMEGAKTGRELPGIVDQIITMHWIDFGDDKPARAFVCTSPNPWGYPAKDRAGRLDQIEEPHLGRLIEKLTGSGARKPFTVQPEVAASNTGE